MLASALQKVIAIHIQIFIIFQIIFLFRLLQSIEQNFLFNTVGPCWLSLLNIAVCTCQSQTPNMPPIVKFWYLEVNSTFPFPTVLFVRKFTMGSLHLRSKSYALLPLGYNIYINVFKILLQRYLSLLPSLLIHLSIYISMDS